MAYYANDMNATMDKINELKSLLNLDGIDGEKEIDSRFKKIADTLLKDFKIQKGERKYLITDIEFYWYTDAHRDFITYPRNCPAGMWYFHPSGVDISFKSDISLPDKGADKRPILTPNARFGGILIRSIKPDGWEYVGKKNALEDHPINVADELFDCIAAFGDSALQARLIPEFHEAEIADPEERYIPLRKDTEESKVQKIIKYNYLENCISQSLEKELTDSFKNYLHQKYRYKVKSK